MAASLPTRKGVTSQMKAPAAAVKKRRFFTADDRAGYLLILPFFLFFLFFVLYPIGDNLFNSFTNYNLDSKKWVALRNYARLFQDTIFLRSIYNTFVYAVCSGIPLMVLGFMTALAVNRQTKALYLARALFIFPYITSMVAVSMIWLCIFDPTTGILNKLLELVHLPAQKWLFDEHLAMPCLIGVNIWKNLGYVMLLFLAGLQSIPGELYEAGRVDGAGDIRMVFAITLPSLKPVSFFIFCTICVESFKTFDQVRIMTNGGPLNTTTMVHQIYQRAFTEYQMGYASAQSIFLLAVILLVTLLNFRFGQFADRDR